MYDVLFYMSTLVARRFTIFKQVDRLLIIGTLFLCYMPGAKN